jgi:hypothetical protein
MTLDDRDPALEDHHEVMVQITLAVEDLVLLGPATLTLLAQGGQLAVGELGERPEEVHRLVESTVPVRRRAGHGQAAHDPHRGRGPNASRSPGRVVGRTTRWGDVGVGERRDRDAMTLDDLMDSVEHHCRTMTPVVAALASSEDETIGRLARVLDQNDRKLDRLCHRLRQQVERPDHNESW